MKSKRIIAALDIKDAKVSKGIKFDKIKEVGDPVELAKSMKRKELTKLYS